MIKKNFFNYVIVMILLSANFAPFSTFALSEQNLDKYAQNNILFYDPGENDSGSGFCVGGSASLDVSVCDTHLTERAIALLEANQVRERADMNMERYLYAEKETGVPWQAVATLHFREATMRPEASVYNGQNLTTDGTCYTNIDGQEICGDPNEDAKNGAELLKRIASSIYGVEDLSWSSSLDDWGNAFLAYNRGEMYKCRNVPYTESPYVMNFYDSEHEDMKFLNPADSYGCDGTWYNNFGVEGRIDSQPGALTVFAYLCGMGDGSGNGTTASDSKDAEDGADVTIIGDSITNTAKDAILSKLPQADIYAQDCKTVGYDFSDDCGSSTGENKSGLSIIKELKGNSSLRNKVVFLLGTNTSGFDKLQDVINEVGSGKKIYLMSLYEADTDHESQNRVIRGIVESNQNVKLIDWAAKVSGNASSYLDDGTHPNEAGKMAFAELIYDAILNSNDTSGTCVAKETGGFSSADEAKFIIDDYLAYDLDSNMSELLVASNGGRHANCTAFSAWFVKYYTDLPYAVANGKVMVQSLYDKNKATYADLEISSTPSVYSIASWSDTSLPNLTDTDDSRTYGHTGIVVGIDESTDKIIVAESGWNNPGFTGVHEYSLARFLSSSGSQYLNLNNHLKSGMGLK